MKPPKCAVVIRGCWGSGCYRSPLRTNSEEKMLQKGENSSPCVVLYGGNRMDGWLVV